MILLIQMVNSLGVAPARTIINFEPGLEERYSLRILNSEGKDMRVMISLSGDDSDFVQLEDRLIDFHANESEKELFFNVKLPDNIEKQGLHELEIVISELPAQEELGGATIKAYKEVISQILVMVPYEGAYIEADLDISSRDGMVQFTIPLFNLGTDDVTAQAIISIQEDGEIIDTIESESTILASKKNGKIVSYWNVPRIGKFKATAEVNYNDEGLVLQKDFLVGEKFVRIEGIF